MHKEVLAYLEQNKSRFLEELFELLRIPSVSADTQYKDDVLRAARFLVDHLNSLNVDNVQLLETDGFPVVYGEKIIDPSLPTVMVYGHYDVQPPDPLDLWETDPFEPAIRNEKIYARGACDDKGQMFMHVKAFETLQSLGQLNCNVKFFIEGEEEVGSANLESALEKHKNLLASDLILISDTSMLSMETPSVSIGLRGLTYLEVEVTGPNRDLHSGVYGGAVDNPINVLCEMIAQLKDAERRIAIPGFYDNVRELSKAERDELASIEFDTRAYHQHLDIKGTRGEKGYSIKEQTSIRPCLDVNGIWGGYTGEGAKTVIPSKAHAKISVRLVANQDSGLALQQITDYLHSIAPDTVKLKVTPAPRRQPLPHRKGKRRIQSGGRGDSRVVRQRAGRHLRRRLHSDSRALQGHTEIADYLDGLRPRHRRHSQPQRAFRGLQFHEGRRDDFAVLSQVRRTGAQRPDRPSLGVAGQGIIRG